MSGGNISRTAITFSTIKLILAVTSSPIVSPLVLIWYLSLPIYKLWLNSLNSLLSEYVIVQYLDFSSSAPASIVNDNNMQQVKRTVTIVLDRFINTSSYIFFKGKW